MIKMVAGDPPNQLLVLGLSFKNLDKFTAEPNDTYIRVRQEETGLPMDVILGSGELYRATGKEKTGKDVFIISFGTDELGRLRRYPGKVRIRLNQEDYNLSFNILIFADETEAKMTDELSDFIGPNTKVTTSDRLKN